MLRHTCNAQGPKNPILSFRAPLSLNSMPEAQRTGLENIAHHGLLLAIADS